MVFCFYKKKLVGGIINGGLILLFLLKLLFIISDYNECFLKNIFNVFIEYYKWSYKCL